MKPTTRILAALLTLVMVMGTLAVLPFNVSAYDKTDKPDGTNPPVGTPVPDGIPVYDGVPTVGNEDGSVNLAQASDGAYLIQSAADFMYFRDTVASTALATDVFRLTTDIALNTETFGESGKHNNLNYILNKNTLTFAGTLDGDGHTIYNMYGYTTHWDSLTVALFKDMTGTVKNLNFDGVRLSATWSGGNQQWIAVIAKTVSGTVENVHIKNAYLNDKKTAVVSSIAAYAKLGAVIRNCTCTDSTLTSPEGTVGGIIGFCDDVTAVSTPVTISNCSFNGTAEGGTVGGIFGQMHNNNNTAQYGVAISDCTVFGTVTGLTYAGGILARIHNNSSEIVVENCVNYATVKNASVGNYMAPGRIADPTYGAYINHGVGGIAGALPTYHAASIVLKNCINRGDVEGTVYAGGLVGYSKITGAPLTIQECTNYGDVSAPVGVAGGLVGKMNAENDTYRVIQLTVINSAGYGTVSGDIAGGVVGNFIHSSNTSKITINGLMNDFDITGTSYAGAVVGAYDCHPKASNLNKGFSMTDVWLRGKISATNGQVAVFSAGSPNSYITSETLKTVGYTKVHDYYIFTPITSFDTVPTVTAINCNFDLSFYENGSAVAASDVKSFRYTDVKDTYDSSIVYSDRDPATVEGAENDQSLLAFLAQHESKSTVGYTDSTGTVSDPYPTYIGSDFASDAQTALNLVVTTNNETPDAVKLTPWAMGKNAPVLLTAVGFSGATMSLSGNATLNVKLSASTFDAFGSVSVSFVDANTNIGISAPLASDGYYTVSYTDLRAAELAENMNLYVTMTLDGVPYKSNNALIYSPAIYLTNLNKAYSANGDKADDPNAAKIVNAAICMLAYGVAAETQDGSSTAIADHVAASGITLPTGFSASGYTTEGVMTEADKAIINAHAPGGIGAALAGGVQLSLNGMEDGATVQVSIRNETRTYTADATGKIVLDMIYANMLTEIITFTFEDGDVARMTMGNFLEARRANESEQALAEATIQYMMAIGTYQESVSPTNTYSVIFRDYDGAILGTDYVLPGEAAVAPADPLRENFVFAGWDQSFDAVTEDLVVTAIYTENEKHTVTFVGYDGTTLATEEVYHGFAATAPEAPRRESYIFTGWDTEFTNVTSDLTVTALYAESVPVTVTFVGMDGSVITSEEVLQGSAATAPEAPTVAGYRFDKWDVAFDYVISEMTVTAQYVKTWTVTYLNKDGSVYMTQTLDEGSVPPLPEGPDVKGYIFEKWNPDVIPALTADVTVSPVYTARGAIAAQDLNVMHWTIGGNYIWLSGAPELFTEAVLAANPDVLIMDGTAASNFYNTSKFNVPGYTMWANGTTLTGNLTGNHGYGHAILYKTDKFTQAGEAYGISPEWHNGFSVFPLRTNDGAIIPVVSGVASTSFTSDNNVATLRKKLIESLGTLCDAAIIRIHITTTEANVPTATSWQDNFSGDAGNGYTLTCSAPIDILKSGTLGSNEKNKHYSYLMTYTASTPVVVADAESVAADTDDYEKYPNNQNANNAFYTVAYISKISIGEIPASED